MRNDPGMWMLAIFVGSVFLAGAWKCIVEIHRQLAYAYINQLAERMRLVRHYYLSQRRAERNVARAIRKGLPVPRIPARNPPSLSEWGANTIDHDETRKHYILKIARLEREGKL